MRNIETRSDNSALISRLASTEDRVAVRKATTLAQSLYGGRRNIVGLPLLEHGFRVAETILDLGLDCSAVVAGVLNHVDDEAGFGEVRKVCGDDIERMIRTLRKLDIYTDQARGNKNERTYEAIRRAALSEIEGDVWVVIVRLAMALQTLKEASNCDLETQRLIARDAQMIYAPLANRLGVGQLKWELEDLAFKILQPERYAAIEEALEEGKEDRERRINRARNKIFEVLQEQGISAEISGRSKHIYSIHRKMERKNKPLTSIQDVNALRVILEKDDPEEEGLTETERKKANYANCYRALGIIHSLWEPIPEEIDDYIQHPKPNGYRSLHTAVYDEDHEMLEVQIRTKKMHAEAEQGLAAHWAYKEGGKPSAAMVRQVESLRQMWGGQSIDSTDLSDSSDVVEDPEADRVFVFTPKGDVIDLRKGATPLDFAYAVHTEVGHRVQGAIVNGNMRPLTYKLQSGDVVSINASSKEKRGHPKRDWMNPSAGYTVTTRAQSRIRKWFRENEREKNIELGRATIDRELKQLGIQGTVTISDLLPYMRDVEDEEEFLSQVGFGDISNAQIEGAAALFLRDQREVAPLELSVEEEISAAPQRYQTKRGISIQGVNGLDTKIGKCCNPLPPEPIIGFVTRGRGVTIHHIDCPEVTYNRKMEPERLIEEISWNETAGEGGSRWQVPFYIKAYNTHGLLENIATMLQGQNITLAKTKRTEKRSHIEIFILPEVTGLDQANWIQSKLESFSEIFEVSR